MPRFKEIAVQTNEVELGEMATQTDSNVAVVLSDAYTQTENSEYTDMFAQIDDTISRA